MSEVIPIDAKAAKEAMADKTIPQDTLLPLLDAPLDELATYLRPDSWEARKDYLAGMMRDSIENLMMQLEMFKKRGQPESECRYVMDGCMVGLHVKIGQLLDAWGAPEVPSDKHAAALYVLSARAEHRMALAKWMPDGCTSPPEENELFEPGDSLMIFKNISLAMRPGLSECWRLDQKGCHCGGEETGPEADLDRSGGEARS